MSDPQAAYAVASARLELRLDELREKLRRHEAEPANWASLDLLEHVERTLAALVAEVEAPGQLPPAP